MTPEQKNEIAQKLINIEETSSNMWYQAEYPEENEFSFFDFDKANDTIISNINLIRKMLDIAEPIEVD